METSRERKQEYYYRKLSEYDELVTEINQLSRELGNETLLTHLRLYKEQKDQIEDIMSYFDKVGMQPEKNSAESILSLGLLELHKSLMDIKGTRR